MLRPSICYVDESVHESIATVVTAFVFVASDLDEQVKSSLLAAGLDADREEFKSSARMDSDSRMQAARSRLMGIAGGFGTKIAVVFAPYVRSNLGRQALQALQSVLIRNAIRPSGLSVYFDEGIFRSAPEAQRLQSLFKFLQPCAFCPEENSRQRRGIQVADAVAHSFGQIVKAEITGRDKEVDIGGERTGYPEGTEAPLSWALLMNLRYALMTRPVVYGGAAYDAPSDPVVIDPQNDDPVEFGQNPVLLGWGVQVAPESNTTLREAVERKLGKLWMGCIH